MRTMGVNCSSLKKYPGLSRLEAPLKVAQQSASILIHGNGGGIWGLTCPAVPASIKLRKVRVGPAAGGSLCNSDRPRAANTAKNKWPCQRFWKRFASLMPASDPQKPPKPRGA